MSDDNSTKAAQKGQKIKLNPARVKTTQAASSTDKPRQAKSSQAQARQPQSAQAAPKPARTNATRGEVGGGGEGRRPRSDIRPTARSEGRADARPARRPAFQPPQEQHHSRPRVFFALKVPLEVAEPLQAAQKALRGNWRAVRPEQFHVTLAYLPSIDPARIDDLKRLGTRLAQECPPLTVRLRGTGYFPNEGSPRVWFVKVEGEGLDDLAALLRAELTAMGLEVEENFKAHITLARKKGPAPRVPPRIFELGWEAPQMVLYRSHLQKTGPIYEALSSFRFRAEKVAPEGEE